MTNEQAERIAAALEGIELLLALRQSPVAELQGGRTVLEAEEFLSRLRARRAQQ